MGTEDISTYISTHFWVINMDRQSSQWTCVELDDLSSNRFKQEARNLSRIRVSLEKIISWKASAIWPQSLWVCLWISFCWMILTEYCMHSTLLGPGDIMVKQYRSILEKSPAKSLYSRSNARRDAIEITFRNTDHKDRLLVEPPDFCPFWVLSKWNPG